MCVRFIFSSNQKKKIEKKFVVQLLLCTVIIMLRATTILRAKNYLSDMPRTWNLHNLVKIVPCMSFEFILLYSIFIHFCICYCTCVITSIVYVTIYIYKDDAVSYLKFFLQGFQPVFLTGQSSSCISLLCRQKQNLSETRAV